MSPPCRGVAATTPATGLKFPKDAITVASRQIVMKGTLTSMKDIVNPLSTIFLKLPGAWRKPADRQRAGRHLEWRIAVKSFPEALKKARKAMGWDQRSLATALRISDKTIGFLERNGSPDLPAAQDVLEFMNAYGVEFADDFSSPPKVPDPDERYFLTLDFRFDRDPDKQVHDIARRMRVVGMSVVRRLDNAKLMASTYDGVELHIPPVNRGPFEAVLADFLAQPNRNSSVNCLVRNQYPKELTVEDLPSLWAKS